MFDLCSGYFGALMNSWVHVVMYSYYGLSAIPSLRDKLWWKKYITRFQLVSGETLLGLISMTFSLSSLRQSKSLLSTLSLILVGPKRTQMGLFFFLECRWTFGKDLFSAFQIQFIVTGTHSYLNLYLKCDFPDWGKHLLCWYMVILFTLFTNFYIKSYLTRKAKKETGSHKSAAVTNGFATNGAVTASGTGEPNGNVSVVNGHSTGQKKED